MNGSAIIAACMHASGAPMNESRLNVHSLIGAFDACLKLIDPLPLRPAMSDEAPISKTQRKKAVHRCRNSAKSSSN